MDAPGGTSAPMSRPFGPVPMPADPFCRRKSLVKVDQELVDGVELMNRGAPTMLPSPGQLVGNRQWSTRSFITPLVKFSNSNGVLVTMLPLKIAPAPPATLRKGSPKLTADSFMSTKVLSMMT